MNIYPKDLGPAGQRAIQDMRAVYPADVSSPQSRSPVAKSAIVGGVGLGGYMLIAAILSHVMDLLIVGVCIIALSSGIGWVTRRNRKHEVPLEKPLEMHEVRYVEQTAQDSLTRAFLELVITAIGTPATDDGEADRSVQEALGALGAGIMELALENTHEPKDDPMALKARAEALRGEFAGETDPVVAASIGRRADALARQAEVASRTGLLLRRNEALRKEISDQIGALRTSLTAIRVGGRQTAPELAAVAASIQSVAIEAGALTQARDEIQSLVSRVQG